jgi:acyl carrier protein
MVDEVAAKVEEYVRARFRVSADDTAFGTDVNLWELGYVDSVGAVEMIVFLEQTYGVQLPEEVLFDPDFTNIRGIARLVTKTVEDAAA